MRDARRLPLVIGGSIGVLGLLGLLITASPVSLGIIAARADGAATSLASSDSAPFSIDENAVRDAAKAFVDSLGDDVKPHAYYADASKQVPQWQICTIVQQCLVPDYGLAVGRLSPASRTHFFWLLSLALSPGAYKRVMVQQLSNLLLGEMQTWAVQCDGQCDELDDPNGVIPDHLLGDDRLISHTVDGTSFEDCGKLAAGGRHTLWTCHQPPRMVLHGNMDTASGRYVLGNIFAEQTIHARNNFFDFVSVYGSLEPGEPFGFRYSGHHFDLNFAFDGGGKVTDLPVFLGHNPLIVPRQSPAVPPDHEDYIQWRNTAGIPQFPEAIDVMLTASTVLPQAAFVPLTRWDSTPSNGGLTLKGGKAITDEAHVELSSLSVPHFEKLWSLVEYTLAFSRGGRPMDEEREAFRREGVLCWTSVEHKGDKGELEHLPKTLKDLTTSRSFFYVRAETKDYLFFLMVNCLFTLVLETEPSNHLHSLLIPKSFLSSQPARARHRPAEIENGG